MTFTPFSTKFGFHGLNVPGRGNQDTRKSGSHYDATYSAAPVHLGLNQHGRDQALLGESKSPQENKARHWLRYRIDSSSLYQMACTSVLSWSLLFKRSKAQGPSRALLIMLRAGANPTFRMEPGLRQHFYTMQLEMYAACISAKR